MNGKNVAKLVFVVLLTLWSSSLKLKAQLPLPPDPFYQLNSWYFLAPDWLSTAGDGPLSFTNVDNPPSFDGNALQVDSTNAAWMAYAIEDSYATNLNFNNCSIEMWVLPDWNSGVGPGDFGRLIDVGAYSTNNPSSWLSLYLSPDGTRLNFSSETNGVFTNYLSVPIAWDTNDWNYVCLTYNHFRSELYTNGVLAATGGGMYYTPSAEAFTNGIFVGSDVTGTQQSRALINDLATYNYSLSEYAVSNDYATGYQLLSPSGGFQTTDSSGGGPMPPGFGGGDGTNGVEPRDSTYTPPDYGTNLWIAEPSISSNYFDAFASNTVADVEYEIQTIGDLTQTNWISQGFFLGSETTNYTPLNPLLANYTTNCFVRLRSWEDTDDIGIPDWWQLEYFGYVGIDLYADPGGDGWNNLQKFLNGMNPYVFYTPPAPANFSASYDLATSTETLNWSPSQGSVTGYLLSVNDEETEQTTNIELSVTNTSFSMPLTEGAPDYGDLPYGPAIHVTFGLQAIYGTNLSAMAGPLLAENDPAPSAQLVYGDQGQLEYVFQGLPANLSEVRIFRSQDSTSDYVDWPVLSSPYADNDSLANINSEPINDGYFEIPAADITNGVCELPVSQIPEFWTYNFWVQTVCSNGAYSAWTASNPSLSPAYSVNEPFLDARRQIKDNLIFLLRAGLYQPFGFTVDGTSEGDGYPSFAWPENYVYADFYGASSQPNPFRPLYDNFFYHNFLFDQTNLNSSGFPNTGCYIEQIYGAVLYITNHPQYYFDAASFVTSTNPAVPASQLSSALSQWILPSYGETEYFSGGTFASGQTNYYGLPLLSEEIAWPSNYVEVVDGVSPGDTLPSGVNGVLYGDVAQPGFQSSGYDFARPNVDLMPGQDEFSPTSAPPVMVVGMGNSLTVAGYNVLLVTNGASWVSAYLGQYFAGAYQINTNGVVTTNSAGILSPYGVFTPTVPGPAALVTMPDIDPPYEQGTCAVYAVSLQLDANHDGTMDLSATSPDATSPQNPMRVWVNDGNDGTGVGEDIEIDGNTNLANYTHGQIRSERNLENFFRLWICGLPPWQIFHDCTFTLSMAAESGSPAINLYPAADYYGSASYLTDTNIALEQIDTTPGPNIPYGVSLGTINATQSCTLPINGYDDPTFKYYLFEGAGIGSGQLTLTISQSNNVIATTSVWLDIHDVKDFYEQAYATNVTSGNPPSSLVSNFSVIKNAPHAPDETSQIVVFIHGINNTDSDFQDTCKTIYKRMYWSGYHGRFSGFHWPCALLPPSTINPFEFNIGEFYAWKSATALKNYLWYLRDRPDLAGYDIDLFAHSQGNIVTSEAIEQGATFDNYILTQGAVPAHCYDTNTPFLASLVEADETTPTPFYATNGGYHGYFAGLQGNLVNFYNTNDFALVSGSYYDIAANWVQDQKTQKPEAFLNGPSYIYYPSNETTIAYYTLSSYTVTDMQESKALVARSRSNPVGAQPGVGGPLNTDAAVDLKSSFGFGNTRPEHSAQFTYPIQTVWGYYDEVLSTYGIQPVNR